MNHLGKSTGITKVCSASQSILEIVHFKAGCGTLTLDITCRSADIAYPQDIDLLDQARENTEKTVDELCELTGQKKPRMYRKRPRKDYPRLSKSEKRSGSYLRKE